MQRHSLAAAPLCLWLRAASAFIREARELNLAYYKVADCQGDATASKQQCEALSAGINQELQRLHFLHTAKEDSTQRRTELADEHMRRLGKLATLQRLLGASELEHERWVSRAARLRAKLEELAGSLVLLCCYVSWAGAVSIEKRQKLLGEWWCSAEQRCVTLPRPGPLHKLHESGRSEAEAESTDEGAAGQSCWSGVDGRHGRRLSALLRVCHGTKWALHHAHAAQLPTDESLREAALAMSLASQWRYPLLLDPQLAARSWLQGAERVHGLRVAHLGQAGWIETLAQCVEQGLPIALCGIGRERLPNAVVKLLQLRIRPLQHAEAARQGAAHRQALQLAGRQVEVSPTFALYLFSELRDASQLPAEAARLARVIDTSMPTADVAYHLRHILLQTRQPALAESLRATHHTLLQSSSQCGLLEWQVIAM